METDSPEKKYFDYTPSDEELYFVESPYYWVENNPSALVKVSHGYLRLIGNEVCQNRDPNSTSDNVPNYFGHDILTGSEVAPFAEFFQNGIKYGTINVSNAESDNFEMLKRMYGSVVYIVLESRSVCLNNPRLKHSRCILFYTEAALCSMNSKYLLSDEGYFKSIRESDSRKTSLDRTREKLYRNGFRLCNGGAYYQYPTESEFWTIKDREKLNSEDLINLLWKAVSDAHPDEGRLNSDPSAKERLAFQLFRSNIIGFGWLPCLFAKSSLNELDRCIIHLYERGNIHNVTDKLMWNFGEQCKKVKSDESGKRAQVVVFRGADGKVNKLPLNKVIKIDDSSSKFKITMSDGKTIESDICELADDYPEILNIMRNLDGNMTAEIKFTGEPPTYVGVDWSSETNSWTNSLIKYISVPKDTYSSDGTRGSSA